MKWNNLIFGVVIIYITYYSANILIDFIKQKKTLLSVNSNVVEIEDFEEEKAISISEETLSSEEEV